MSAPAAARILCLHGFAQTGPVFSAKSSGIRKMLKKHKVETLYLDGPIQLKAEDLPFDVSNASSVGAEVSTGNGDEAPAFDFKSWWYNIDDFDIEPAITKVGAYIKENGPFDGVMGFSQGAAFAQLITNHMESLGNNKPVKFAIYFSGYETKNPEVNKKYLTEKITVPTLHIMGELDTVVSSERSSNFVDKYTQEGTATIFKHPGGHYVPNQKPVVKQWAEWVANVLKDGNEDNGDGEAAAKAPAKAPKNKAQKKKQQPAQKEERKDETAAAAAAAAAKKDAEELEKLGEGIDNLGVA